MVAAGLPIPDQTITVETLFERFLKDVAPTRITTSTLVHYRTIARVHLVPELGHRRLIDLTPAEVQALLRSKTDAGYSANTVRQIRGLLVQCLRQAERWGLVGRNVAALTDGPRISRSEGRTLTIGQAKSLLDAAKGDRLEACYVLLLSLGLRRGEALGLRWSDVDLDAAVIVVRQALRKVGSRVEIAAVKTTGSRRAINLPREVVSILRTHRARQNAERLVAGEVWKDSGLVFTTGIGTAVDPSSFRKLFDKVCASAGIQGWHPHELRHSAASIMLASGVPLEVVSRVLGHASIRITADVYAHMMDPQRQLAADAMSSALWKSTGGERIR